MHVTLPLFTTSGMRDHLSVFYDLSIDLMCVIDRKGRFADVNPAWEKIFGWTREELRGKAYAEYIHPEDFEHSQSVLKRVIAENGILNCQSRFRTRSGEYRHLVWTGKLGPCPEFFFATAKDITDQERENQSARENAQRLQALFDSLSEAVLVFDRADHIGRWNKSALKIFRCVNAEDFLGLTRNVVIYDTDMNVVPLDKRPSATAMRTGVTQSNITVAVERDQQELQWLNVSAVPLFRDGDPVPFEVLFTARDVTTEQRTKQELQRAQESVEEQRRFLTRMVSHVHSLVSYLDRDLRYTYVNHRYEELYGRPARDFIGRKVSDIVGEHALPVVEGGLNRALGGETVRATRELDYKDIGRRMMQISYVPDLGNDGRVRGIFVVIYDLTSYSDMLKSLREKDQFIIRLLDLMPAAMSYWDRGCHILYSNKCHHEFHGGDPEGVRGLHARQALPQGVYELNLSRTEAVLRGELQEFERKLMRNDGNLRHLQTSFIPDVVDGEVIGFLVYNADITHMKELEEERRQMEIRLMGASKLSALGEMARGIAHEINNPLAIILGKASLLREDIVAKRADGHQVVGELAAIETVVERIAKVIRSLRKVARDGDREPMFPESVPRLLDETLELCRERFTAKHVALRVKCQPGLEVTCRGSQISQILINLLSNSLEAVGARREKWIELSGEKVGGYARISIKDSGERIHPDVAANIMQPFFTTKNSGQGAGLGLTVASRLAQLNGGTLRYEPNGSNTCFVLELPVSI